MTKVHELIKTVIIALQQVRTSEEQLVILDKFTTDEVYEFARGVVIGLPKYTNDLVETVNQNIFTYIPAELYGIASQQNIHELFRAYMRKEDRASSIMPLVFALLLEYNKEFPKVDIDIEIGKQYQYYMSHIIQKENLIAEVGKNPVIGFTIETPNGYIRRTVDGQLIPTTKTEDLSNSL